jgi:hypothetical protein
MNIPSFQTPETAVDRQITTEAPEVCVRFWKLEDTEKTLPSKKPGITTTKEPRIVVY